MVCRYCGLETGSGVGHPSQADCISALHQEIDRAKRLIDRTREETRSRVERRPETGVARVFDALSAKSHS